MRQASRQAYDMTYDCCSVLKHVHNNRKSCRGPVVSRCRMRQTSYRVNRPLGWQPTEKQYWSHVYAPVNPDKGGMYRKRCYVPRGYSEEIRGLLCRIRRYGSSAKEQSDFFPRISGSPSKNKFLQRSNVTLIYITGSVKITEKELVEQVISVVSGTLQILTFLSVASNARNARSNAERNGEAESCWSRVNNCRAFSVTSNARNTRSNAERNDEAKSCRSRVNNCQEPSKDRIIKIYTPNKTLDSDWTRVEHFSDPILLCTVPKWKQNGRQ